ncbi:redoxin domain-containing protein [bacterium]|jgi:peroxiredoxin|nr:peroxiredoxin [Gemmatimonadota bacterium]MCH2664955.1 redoxin domain-containing protein [bacterium]
MAISVGDQAPDFTLKRKAGDLIDVTLSSYKGNKNVVLLFVPLAYSGPCTEELCSVSGGLSDYEGLDAEVIAISVDSPFAQEAWAKDSNINVPLVSDFNKEVCQAYGCMHDELLGFKGVAKRSAFVLDKSGVVRFAAVSDDASVLPDFEAIKSCLSELNK